jgi:glutaredoxin
MVRLYGFKGCPYCDELKDMYDKNNIDYTFVDVTLKENDTETEKVFKIANEESVPIILVKKTILAPEKSFKSIEEAYDLTLKFLNE